ncbi:hypothetical protein TrST_g7526 [Triparma strigata]|uniref:Uncharacterized protein n=1 Tax=Triparma strigata TaxID=1606541 RepID=A0A9W7E089_9STRA|nr:hypothetical protein TrST_g7526 [Triparma strigata]
MSTQSPTSLASGQGFGKSASARKKKGSWKDAPSAGLASDLPYSSPEVSAAASGKGEEPLPTVAPPSDQLDLIEKLRAEIKLAEDKIVSESKGRADAEKVAADVKGQKDIAEKMAEQRAAEAADQQEVIDQLTAHITDAEQKIENQKRAALVAEATAKEDMEMKEKELNKIKKLKKQAKTQDMLIIEGLRENLAQAKDDFVQAKDEAVARVTEVREDWEGRLKKVNDELAETLASVKTLETEINNKNMQLASKDEEISEKDEVIEQQRAQISEMESRLTKYDNQVFELDRDLESASGELDAMRAAQEELKAEVGSLEMEVARVKAKFSDEINKMEEDKLSTQRDLESFRKSEQIYREDSEKMLTVLKQKIVSKEYEITAYEQELTNIKPLMGRLREAVNTGLATKLSTGRIGKFRERARSIRGKVKARVQKTLKR